MEKGKAKEPLQEGIPNPPSIEENLPHEADVHPELSTDVGYDEPKTFIPSFSYFSKRRRRLFLLASSVSEDETYFLDEQEEVGSPSYNIAEERFTFHGQPWAHRPITKAKNKLRLNSKLRDNPRLKDLVININDKSNQGAATET